MHTCPETPAKLEVLSTFMEAKIPLAANAIAAQVCLMTCMYPPPHMTHDMHVSSNAIAAQVHERSEEAMAVKNEEIKKLSGELEVLKKQSAAELEEASTKLKQACVSTKLNLCSC